MGAAIPATVAGYPVRIEELCIGDLRLRMLVVADLERFVDRDALLRDGTAPEPPYWAHVWTASRVLARLVAERGDWIGKRVLDVGCGLGLPGVVAAMKGATVVATDTAPEALAMTRASAGLNGCRISVVRDDLRCSALEGRFDRCLAADVTYDPGLQRALAELLSARLAVDGLAWCAESVRTRDTGFRDACEANGLRIVESEVNEREDGHIVPVRVAQVERVG